MFLVPPDMAFLVENDMPNDTKRGSAPRFDDHEFRKSSFTKPGVHFCVEVAQKDGVTAVRNSNDAAKNTVFFTQNEWKAFVAGVKNDEFNV